MENQKSNKGLIGVLIATIIILLLAVCYFAFGKDLLKENEVNIQDNNVLCTKTVSFYNNKYSFVYKTEKSSYSSFDDIVYDIKINNDYIDKEIKYESTAEYTQDDLKVFCLDTKPEIIKVKSKEGSNYNYYVIATDGLTYGSYINLYSVNSNNYKMILDLSLFACTGWKKDGKDIPGVEIIDNEIFVVNNTTTSGINYPVGSRVKLILTNGSYSSELVESGLTGSSGIKA